MPTAKTMICNPVAEKGYYLCVQDEDISENTDPFHRNRRRRWCRYDVDGPLRRFTKNDFKKA